VYCISLIASALLSLGKLILICVICKWQSCYAEKYIPYKSIQLWWQDSTVSANCG